MLLNEKYWFYSHTTKIKLNLYNQLHWKPKSILDPHEIWTDYMRDYVRSPIERTCL